MTKEYDPRMHSVEHILNQTMIRMFSCGRCFSAHIEKKKSKCDYRLDRALTEDELAEIEKRVNEIIRQDLPVTEEFYDMETAARLFNLDKLPSDVGREIRIVRVGDYDACPCIGPHVSRTSRIGGFRIVSADHNGDFLRLRFKLTATGEESKKSG